MDCNFCHKPIVGLPSDYIHGPGDRFPNEGDAWCGKCKLVGVVDDYGSLKKQNESLWELLTIALNERTPSDKIVFTPKTLIPAIELVMKTAAPKHNFANPLDSTSFMKRFDSAQRHLSQWKSGVDEDADDALPTLAKAITQLALLLHSTLNCPDNDDRIKESQ